MNKDIIKMELKRTLIGLLIWTIAIGISLFLIVILYPIVKICSTKCQSHER